MWYINLIALDGCGWLERLGVSSIKFENNNNYSCNNNNNNIITYLQHGDRRAGECRRRRARQTGCTNRVGVRPSKLYVRTHTHTDAQLREHTRTHTHGDRENPQPVPDSCAYNYCTDVVIIVVVMVIYNKYCMDLIKN